MLRRLYKRKDMANVPFPQLFMNFIAMPFRYFYLRTIFIDLMALKEYASPPFSS